MSGSPRRVAAVILLDRSANALGLPAAWDAPLGEAPVLTHTLRRLARCRQLDRIVLVHPRDQQLLDVPDDPALAKRIKLHATDAPLYDEHHATRLAARKWSPTAWRGGLGGMTCYDELLSAGVMLEALEAHDATAALLVGSDWPLVDPELCDAVIDRHLEQPDTTRLAFTQAPPGVCGCVLAADLLTDLRDHGTAMGPMLEYNPRAPQADPIAKDVCVQIDAAVRDGRYRATADAPRWRRLLDAAVGSLSADEVAQLDAGAVATRLTAAALELPPALPQQVTLELNTKRGATGPVVPQHHVDLSREPITLDRAASIFEQLAAEPDVALTLGGLGDALLHEQWEPIVSAARDAGLWGLHVETDLLVGEDVLPHLLAAPLDVLSVRINADSAEVYEKLMGRDGFAQVLGHIEWLLNQRRRSERAPLPWIVPRLVKTADNVEQLESFFDRWVHYCGHAVIEPPTTGCDLMPDQGVIDMRPPRRRPCRQLGQRMGIHSDGQVALCDQDWQARAALGDLNDGDLATIWQNVAGPVARHRADECDQLPLCNSCREWHRP